MPGAPSSVHVRKEGTRCDLEILLRIIQPTQSPLRLDEPSSSSRLLVSIWQGWLSLRTEAFSLAFLIVCLFALFGTDSLSSFEVHWHALFLSSHGDFRQRLQPCTEFLGFESCQLQLEALREKGEMPKARKKGREKGRSSSKEDVKDERERESYCY